MARLAPSAIQRGGRAVSDDAHRDGPHGIALPPANACAHRDARRSSGGARPIASCAARAAAFRSDRAAFPSATRAARAQRTSVGQRFGDSTLIRRAQIRRRTSASDAPVIAHSVSAMAIAAWP